MRSTYIDWDLGVALHYECQRKQIRKASYFNQWIDLRATYKVHHWQHNIRPCLSAVDVLDAKALVFWVGSRGLNGIGVVDPNSFLLYGFCYPGEEGDRDCCESLTFHSLEFFCV